MRGCRSTGAREPSGACASSGAPSAARRSMQRRLDVGGVIRRVSDIYVGQAPVLMPAAAVVFVISGLLSAVLESAGTLSSLLLALVISLLAETVFTGMVVMLVADVQDGRRDSSAGQLLRAVTPVLGQLVLVAIVFGFAL